MSDDALKLGELRKVDGGFAGRLERLITHDRAAVWRMLTEPEELPKWLAPGTIELRLGGAVRIDFADSGTVIASKVAVLEPLSVLAYSWSSGSEPERPLRWELATEGDATRVRLTVRLPAGEDAARACAGFDCHLEMMAAALEGVPMRFPLPHFLAARKGYQRLLEG